MTVRLGWGPQSISNLRTSLGEAFTKTWIVFCDPTSEAIIEIGTPDIMCQILLNRVRNEPSTFFVLFSFKKPLSQLDMPEYVLKANAYGPHTISYAWPNGRALLEKQVMEVLRKEPEDHIDFSCWNGDA